MTTEEYIAAQNEWLKANNIHDGDEIKVFCSAEDYEDGWGDGWLDEMNDCVGLIGTVHINSEHPENGIRLSFDSFRESRNFPYFVLDPTLKRDVIMEKDWIRLRRAEMYSDNDIINLLARWLSRSFDCPYGEDHMCNYKCGDACRDMKRQHPECWINAAKEELMRGEE